MNLEQYYSILAENYLSDTRSRKLIFDVLHELHRPVTLPELVKITSGEMDKTTVYRSVDLFCEVGITKRVSLSSKESIELSDLFKEHHHHMVCINCKKVIKFKESKGLNLELEKLLKKHKFKGLSHSIEFSGHCKNCR
jgi:Fur family ferric uptake transcriptional regulator